MVISLLETVIITNVLHHSSMKYQQVPNWVRVVILRHIARLICYKWPKDVQEKDAPENGQEGSGPYVIQQTGQTPAQQPISTRGDHNTPAPILQKSTCLHARLTRDPRPSPAGAAVLPELQRICQYLDQLQSHVASLQKEGELRDQWCHVGYILDFLLFRVYLLLISCYALVIIFMWCVWISQS